MKKNYFNKLLSTRLSWVIPEVFNHRHPYLKWLIEKEVWKQRRTSNFSPAFSYICASLRTPDITNSSDEILPSLTLDVESDA